MEEWEQRPKSTIMELGQGAEGLRRGVNQKPLQQGVNHVLQFSTEVIGNPYHVGEPWIEILEF